MAEKPEANPQANHSFEITLKDNFDKRGLTVEDLKSHQCTENVLVRLSKNLENWEVVGFWLGLVGPEIRAIRIDSNSEEERRIKALNKWKEKKGDDATYYNLIEALNDYGNVEMIDRALDLLKDFLLEKEKEEEQKEMERQKEREMKANFYQKIKSQLLAKGLLVPDLQVNIREEDVDAIAELVGKDWYTFGKYMKVEESTLDHIKEVGGSKLGRKKKLLEYFISKKLRYEDIIYGLYNASDEHNPSINGVLDYLLTQRESEDPKSNERQNSKQRRPRSKLHQQQDVPWQAIFEERELKPPKLTKSRGHLTPETYADHFFDMLWLEEKEHMKKLEE
uniref:Death domain-containing protein n=1 Tax=Amphimedon queenslandica TaxID=400682 RepID=A0A1X7SS23_AMPQE